MEQTNQEVFNQSTGDQGQIEQQQDERNYEDEASEMGWRPQDQFKGDPDKWVDAKEFVERGEHILPILKANTNKLRAELLTRDQELAKLRASVEASDKAIKVMRKHYQETQAREAAQVRSDLLQQLKDAKLLGDVDSEVDLLEKLQTLPKQEASSTEDDTKETGGKNNEQEPQFSPEFIEWKSENPWFENASSPEDMKRTRKIVRIAYDLRDDGDTTQGKAFFEKCVAMLDAREGKGNRVSKVEGAGGPSGVTRGGRAFDRLPKEAKDICHDDNNMFVGPGKMFKTVKEWEDHYASIYSAEG